MRIGFLTYGMSRELTGIGRYTVELTRALQRLYGDTEIILLNPYPDANLPWYKEFATFPIPQLRLMPAVASLGNVVLHQAALKLKLDILHDPCGVAPFLLPTRRYKRVTTVHDAIPFIYPKTQPLLTRWIFHSLIRAASFTADAVLTVSHSAAEDLQRYAGIPAAKLHVTPPGGPYVAETDAAARRETLNRLRVSRPFFLYVGALHPRKNLSRVLRAFADVQARYVDAQLVIVGPPSWGASQTLAEVLNESKRGDRVIFTGYVSDEALHHLYAEALCLVFPSLYEGFGLPALEAMAHGTPVIGSNVSSLPEVLGDAGLLVDPARTDLIAEAMTRLLTEPTLHRALCERGRNRAKMFTWENTARKTLEVYRSLSPAT